MDPVPGSSPAARPPAPPRAARSLSPRAASLLFAAGLTLYAATRFIGLTEFPIFFFCDEAIQANTAENLVRNHFRDENRVLLPSYFLNDQRRAMSLNIYLLTAPIALFGKSVLVTRATFAAVSLLGAAALGIGLLAAGSGLWWAAPFLLACIPVDFLHSRWAMETTPACYAGFLCAYLLYRMRSSRYVFLAIALGAATFYSYTAGQGIVLVMGALLLVVDARYHFRQPPARLAAAAVLILLLAAPAWREHRLHPGTTIQQLTVLHSYWLGPMPLAQKLAIFFRNYAQGFDPRYWFLPNGAELIRHRMDGMAFVPLVVAPFVLIGLAACLIRMIRSPAHRVILLSPLGVPFAAAVHERQMLRLLPMTVPIVLLAIVGADEVRLLLRRWLPDGVLAAGLAGGLTAASVSLCAAAFAEGPTWFRDYGLYGMQYGARQIAEAAREELSGSPTVQIRVSASWANNPLPFLDFFFAGPERARIDLGDLGPQILFHAPLPDDWLWVMTPEEYEKARRDPKFALRPPTRVLPFPDGRPGFYFVRVRYGPNADALFAAERDARRALQEVKVVAAGQRLVVRHSIIDSGSAEGLFDGDVGTLLRGLEANPFVLEIEFPRPRPMKTLALDLGRMDGEIRVEIFPEEGSSRRFARSVQNRMEDTHQEFSFGDTPVSVKKIRVEVEEPGVPEPQHFEIREVAFR